MDSNTSTGEGTMSLRCSDVLHSMLCCCDGVRQKALAYALFDCIVSSSRHDWATTKLPAVSSAAKTIFVASLPV